MRLPVIRGLIRRRMLAGRPADQSEAARA